MPTTLSDPRGARVRAVWLGSWALTAALAVPGLAQADATVAVELKGPGGAIADGTVTLVKGEARFACTTAQGRCTMRNVPSGMYSVEVSVAGKPSPKPKQVMIPPSGEAKLVVQGG